MKRAATLILTVSIVVLTPIFYVRLLDAFFPIREFKFLEGFADRTFLTEYRNPTFIEEEFNLSEWSAVPVSGYANESTGFTVENGCLILYATFNGWGKTGIEIKKPVQNISTTTSPFVVIRFRASSSDTGLMFSLALIDSYGDRYAYPWRHVATNWTSTEFDLRDKFNGTMSYITVRFTNDFDPSYVGGKQWLFIERISLYRDSPDWKLSQNKPVEANISSESGVLRISGKGNVSEGTIVTAQRSRGFSFNLSTYKYLNVSIKTSSINVAARIVIWTDLSDFSIVLLKTYNDDQWHTEIVDLSFCGVTGDELFMVELGLMQVYDVAELETMVYYKELSFCRLEKP